MPSLLLALKLMLFNLELGSRPAFLTICLNNAGSASIIMSKPVMISLLSESDSCDFRSLSKTNPSLSPIFYRIVNGVDLQRENLPCNQLILTLDPH